MEFQIPLSREDLLRYEGAHYAVSECCSPGEVVARLEECRSLLDNGRLQSISECFPAFFSIIQNFLNIGKSVREAYWKIAVKALEGACHQVGVANIAGMTQAKKTEMRNSLKMMVYVVVQLVEEFETDATKPNSLDVVGGKRGGKKKKKNVSETHSSGMDWGQERRRVVELACDLVECDLWLLWEPPSVQMMEDFSNLVLSMCYKLLENPGFVREKVVRDKVFFLMGTLIKKYNMGLGVGMKVPQLLQHFEHLPSPLAQAMQCWTQEFGAKSVVSEVIRELGRKDPHDLSLDTSGTRCFATFLVELSQLVPAAVLPAISVLIPHLGGESYTMRNGVLGVIGETVTQVLSSPQLDQPTRQTRDKLLDHLEQHLHDVNAFVRSRVLQIWLQLAKAKAIPLPRLKAVLPLVCGRSEDKSSNVRKNALQLLTNILATNPFAAKLDVREFQASLVKEENKLKTLLPPDRDLTDVTSPNGQQGEGERAGEGEGGGEGGREVAEEVAKQITVVKYLRDGVKFIQVMSSCIPVCTRLLGSKVITDVLESLEFLTTAVEFQVQGSREGVRKALSLVWSSEQQIREAVLQAYVRLYLTPQTDDPREATLLTIRNLLSLTHGASHGEIAALDEMMTLLVGGKSIPSPVIKMLWDIFTHSIDNVTQSHSRSAILLLSMIAGVEQEIVKTNLKLLITHGLSGENPDLVVAKDCCVMFQKLAVSHSQSPKPASTSFRYPRSHPMFQRMTSLMVSQFSSPSSSQWTPFAEQAIAAIYKLCEQPDVVCGDVLKVLAGKVCPPKMEDQGGEKREGEEKEREKTEEGEESDSKGVSSSSSTVNSLVLSRLIFTAGHVAQWQVFHLEGCVARELKRRREVESAEDEEREKGRDGERRGGTPLSSGRGRKTPRKTPDKKPVSPSLEEEMGLTGATADDADSDLIRRVCEVEVASTGLLSHFEPIIVDIVSNPSKFQCPLLQTSAVLSLSKYMMISQSLCDKYLQLLFTVLEKSPEATIRANTIVAAGDLAFRYPNLTEPWTPRLYARLRDSAPLVRKNTLIVLTHLILNDMIKVKGQISEVALVLEDSDQVISERARLFFTQLARKGNDMYNVLPNIISSLSDPQREVPREKFRSIAKFLFSFIQKDKQCESLVEKLCHRFRSTRTEQQWRDLAHCLSQINFTARCVRKLQDNFQCYQDKLVDQDIYTCFTGITNKAKKFAKPDAKALIVELEDMMKTAREKGLEDVGEERGVEEGGGGGVVVGEGEVEERGGEGEGELPAGRNEEEREGQTSPHSPPTLKRISKKKAKTTQKKSQRRVAIPAEKKSDTVKVKGSRLRAAPAVEKSAEDELTWSEDGDFKTDVLSSARKAAIVNSGSITKRKPVRSVRRRKIQRLVYSSDEGLDQSPGDESEGDTLSQQKVPPQFTFSDDDN